jgi:hypothetical protein
LHKNRIYATNFYNLTLEGDFLIDEMINCLKTRFFPKGVVCGAKDQDWLGDRIEMF